MRSDSPDIEVKPSTSNAAAAAVPLPLPPLASVAGAAGAAGAVGSRLISVSTRETSTYISSGSFLMARSYRCS